MIIARRVPEQRVAAGAIIRTKGDQPVVVVGGAGARRFMWRQVLEHMDELDTRLLLLSERIQALTAPYESIIQRLDAIPGVGRYTAAVILAEIGPM